MILKRSIPIAERPTCTEPFHECYFRSPCYQGTFTEVPINVGGEVAVIPCIKLDEKDRLKQWLHGVGAQAYEHNADHPHLLAARIADGGLCELLCEWVPDEETCSGENPYRVIIRARTGPNMALPKSVSAMLKDNGYEQVSEDSTLVESLRKKL